jgi:hypothetical protein
LFYNLLSWMRPWTTQKPYLKSLLNAMNWLVRTIKASIILKSIGLILVGYKDAFWCNENLCKYPNSIWNKESVFVCLFVCLMVFSAIFNNISVISWQSFLFVKETGGSGENLPPVASHWQTISHNVVHLALIEIRTHNISGDR